jgi:hypothetical protein
VSYRTPRDPVAAAAVRSAGTDAVQSVLKHLPALMETALSGDPRAVAEFVPATVQRADCGEIIGQLFGLSDGDPKPEQEVAAAYRLTIAEVREVASWTLERLRHLMFVDDDLMDTLRDFIETAGSRALFGRTAQPAEFFSRHDQWDGQRCLTCDTPLPYAGKGRPRTTCSPRCRQSLYRRRHGAGSQQAPLLTEPYRQPLNEARPHTRWAPRNQAAGYASFEDAVLDFRHKVSELQKAVAKPYSLMVGHQVHDVWEAGWYFSKLLRDRQLPVADATSKRAVLTALAGIIDELGRLAEADDDVGRAQWHNSTRQKAVKALARFTRIAVNIVALLDDLSGTTGGTA